MFFVAATDDAFLSLLLERLSPPDECELERDRDLFLFLFRLRALLRELRDIQRCNPIAGQFWLYLGHALHLQFK